MHLLPESGRPLLSVGVQMNPEVQEERLRAYLDGMEDLIVDLQAMVRMFRKAMFR